MSFQQGLSGLNATAKNLEIIGNNIANANTYGAKASRGEFADVYAAALNGAGTNAVGIGTRLAAVSQQFTQGNVSTTENPMDLAINGAGFFQVQENGTTYYTRNGQFKVDRDGYIVNNGNLKLLGFPSDANGQVQEGGMAVPLQLSSNSRIDPEQTTAMTVDVNLDSRKAAPTAPFDMTNLESFNNATSVTVFDQQGRDAALTTYYRKTAENEWDVYFSINGTLVDDGLGTPQTVHLTFTADGKGLASDPTGSIPLVLPAAADGSRMQISIDELDFGNSTQYGTAFGADINQDGFAAGQLVNIAIESNGYVMARYSNGKSQAAGRIQLATFRNPQGLQPLGNNLWGETYSSNQPNRNWPESSNMGSLQAGALEESNVDLTAELVGMITAQRIYQANAQTIKTMDQVMQTLVNLR